MGYQYQNVCVTVNLPLDGTSWEDYDLEILRTRLNPTFMIMGKEEVGRKHFQGYFQIGRKMMGQKIDRIFRLTFPLPMSVHFEAAKGTAEQNIEYCSKEDENAFRFGEPAVTQGKRSDLTRMVELVKEGKTDLELLEENPGAFLVHHRAFQVVRSILAPKRTWASKLVFIWGATGLGKTRESMKLEPQKIQYRDPFMIGYNGQKENVLFDDFKWTAMDPKYWLEVCDRYEMTVENKGTTVNWAPKVIIFTSNDNPRDWWPDAPQATKDAISRRMEEFGEILHLESALPLGQVLLANYFRVPAAAISPSKEDDGGASASTQVVDLTMSSDDDDEQVLRKRKTVHTSDEEDEPLPSKKKRAPATRCRNCFRALNAKKGSTWDANGVGNCHKCS